MPAPNKDAGAAFASSAITKTGSAQITQLQPAQAANATASAPQTRLPAGTTQLFAPLASRQSATVYNLSASPIYVGTNPNGQANNYLVEPGYGLKVEAFSGAIYVYAPQVGSIQIVSS